MEPSLLSWVNDYKTAGAGLIVALLMGFRWWFAARREIREDQAADTTHDSYKNIIVMLREENERLWKLAEWRSNRIDTLERQVHDLYRLCDEAGVKVPLNITLPKEP